MKHNQDPMMELSFWMKNLQNTQSDEITASRLQTRLYLQGLIRSFDPPASLFSYIVGLVRQAVLWNNNLSSEDVIDSSIALVDPFLVIMLSETMSLYMNDYGADSVRTRDSEAVQILASIKEYAEQNLSDYALYCLVYQVEYPHLF
jgi:hypothetical protein